MEMRLNRLWKLGNTGSGRNHIRCGGLRAGQCRCIAAVGGNFRHTGDTCQLPAAICVTITHSAPDQLKAPVKIQISITPGFIRIVKQAQSSGTTDQISLNRNIVHGRFYTGYSIGLEDLDSDEIGYTFFENAKNNGAFAPILQSIVDRKIDDKTTKERIYDALDSFSGASTLNKILTTEYHHAANEGILTCGDEYKENQTTVFKTWKTMMDEKVRDSHTYLEGKKIPIDSKFYTYNGDHAMFPGGFNVAEEDCNCRCRIKLSKEKATSVTGK